MTPWIPTHKITVPGPKSSLTILVMLDQGDLWQRSEWERRVPFPMWRLVNDALEFRHGVMPAGATVAENAHCHRRGARP